MIIVITDCYYTTDAVQVSDLNLSVAQRKLHSSLGSLMFSNEMMQTTISIKLANFSVGLLSFQFIFY